MKKKHAPSQPIGLGNQRASTRLAAIRFQPSTPSRNNRLLLQSGQNAVCMNCSQFTPTRGWLRLPRNSPSEEEKCRSFFGCFTNQPRNNPLLISAWARKQSASSFMQRKIIAVVTFATKNWITSYHCETRNALGISPNPCGRSFGTRQMMCGSKPPS